jgi:hypothetical protein
MNALHPCPRQINVQQHNTRHQKFFSPPLRLPYRGPTGQFQPLNKRSSGTSSFVSFFIPLRVDSLFFFFRGAVFSVDGVSS